MTQTAVEWLVEQLEGDDSKIARVIGLKKYNSLIQQAKEMEKQQKIEFARHCLEKANRTFDLDILTSFIDVHQYYNEEYGKQ
jgi:hypothetical protein